MSSEQRPVLLLRPRSPDRTDSEARSRPPAPEVPGEFSWAIDSGQKLFYASIVMYTCFQSFILRGRARHKLLLLLVALVLAAGQVNAIRGVSTEGPDRIVTLLSEPSSAMELIVGEGSARDVVGRGADSSTIFSAPPRCAGAAAPGGLAGSIRTLRPWAACTCAPLLLHCRLNR